MRQALSKGMLTAAAATGILSLSGGYAFAADADAVATGSPGVLSGNTVQAPIDVPVNVCGNSVNVVGVNNPASGNGCGNGRDVAPTAASAAATQDLAAEAARSVQQNHTLPAPKLAQELLAAPALAHSATNDRDVPSAQRITPSEQRLADVNGGSTYATGTATGSPGVASGNAVQVPVHAPVNVCGNSVGVVALLSPAGGNACATNGEVPVPVSPPVTPPTPVPPPVTPPPPAPGVLTPVVPAPAAGRVPAEHPRVTEPASSEVNRSHLTPMAQGQELRGAALAETGADENLAGAAAAAAALLIGGAVLYRRGAIASRR